MLASLSEAVGSVCGRLNQLGARGEGPRLGPACGKPPFVQAGPGPREALGVFQSSPGRRHGAHSIPASWHSHHAPGGGRGRPRFAEE